MSTDLLSFEHPSILLFCLTANRWKNFDSFLKANRWKIFDSFLKANRWKIFESLRAGKILKANRLKIFESKSLENF